MGVNVSGGASAPPWVLAVDEAGLSLANWTVVAGAWSVDAGGFLKQTTAAAAYYGLRLTNPVSAGAASVAQMDVRFPTGTVLRRAMFAIGWDGVDDGTLPWAGLDHQVGVVFQRGGTAATTDNVAIPDDTWIKLRVVAQGSLFTVYKDGVLVSAARINGQDTPQIAKYFGLVIYGGEVDVRNVKLWRLAEP